MMYRGLRQQRKNKRTQALVSLYDGREAQMNTEAGRWQTVCETHGAICAHRTLALARRHLGASENWCTDCQDLLAE